MDNNNIDPNKIIRINDCKGTCKTPIGCTCGKMEDRFGLESEIKDVKWQMASENVAVATEVALPKVKQCTCGNNPGGDCGCATGNSCKTKSNGKSCTTCAKADTSSCCSGKNKLEVYDWLNDIPETSIGSQMVEVQFKNTRKGYYLNSNNLELYRGDIVAVEATPGHDIGEVTLTGKLVHLQMLKNNYRGETKRIYRLAKPNDLEKQTEAKAKEHKTMLRAREIAEELKLAMKISDVEYQGDGNKAIFYYIADERVDFRQLIKVYASEFRVKIEMKQIGARQEAGRVGGIGPCGRELCCSSSMSNFVSVSTSAARLQDIPLNPQKLAGQCGKLKCCLNFEVDTYVEAQRKLPSREIPLETKDSTFFHFKTDILSGVMTYSTDKHFAANLVAINKDRAHEIIRMNKNGKRPSHLITEEQVAEEKPVSHDLLENESITRFDNSGNKNKNRNKRRNKDNRPQDQENNDNGNNQGNGNGKKLSLRPNNNNSSNNQKDQNQPQNVSQPQNQGQRQNQSQEPNGQPQNQGQSNKNRNKNRNNRHKNRNSNNGPREDKKPEA